MTQTDLTCERMYKWFSSAHMGEGTKTKETAEPFRLLAMYIIEKIEPGPERTVALRKLLEARDAAIRAVIRPGG